MYGKLRKPLPPYHRHRQNQTLTVIVLTRYRIRHYTCWKLTPLFPLCSFLFVTGFTLRIYGAFHYDHLEMYIATMCITYAAP